MPSADLPESTQPPGRRASLITLAVVAIAVIAARLPFLLFGPRFFDSDEAVEGLMARHVIGGEFPLYLWGQRYKGVPEVYLTAAVFRAATPGVIALKAVTLGCFALYACLNFELLTRCFSRRIAWIATVFLIASSPALVLWTLSGSAEIVMTLVAGTSLLLGFGAWLRTGSRNGLTAAAAALGFGLWIQQYILYYVAAVAVAVVDWTPEGRHRLRTFLAGTNLPASLRLAIRVLTIAAGLYIILGLAAFLGFGFNVTLPGVSVTVTHPQKMWWIGAALLVVATACFATGQLIRSRNRRAWLAPALGFLAGFAPAIIGRLGAAGSGAPIARMDLSGLRAALSPLAGIALPIVFGFKSPAAERLSVPAWSVLIIVAAVVAGFAGLRRAGRAEGAASGGWTGYTRYTRVFHAFLIVTPVVFIASGAFIDAQSYRYLMPLYAALPVVYAIGIDSVLRWNRIAGAVLLTALAGLFVLQQADWYRRLAPDREAHMIIDCLDRAGVRAASADYWLSYKLTFLTGERVIVAPANGPDRYPPYTAIARSQISPVMIERPTPATAVSCGMLTTGRPDSLQKSSIAR